MLLNRRALLLALPLVAVACRRDPSQQAADSLANNPVVQMQRVPHVMAIDLGRGVDLQNRIFGGTTNRFAPADTVFLSVRTQFVDSGAAVSARVLQGSHTVDSISGTTVRTDTAGVAAMPFQFKRSGGWPAGTYQVEVFLNGVSQGLKDFEIRP